MIPPGIAASAQALFSQASGEMLEGRSASSGHASSPSPSQQLHQHPAAAHLGDEQRSNSIGEELKMVMKSERGGRLARDSAEILAGERPGEFTVVTQEGSAIPVAVKDLSSAGSSPVSARARSADSGGAQPDTTGGCPGSDALERAGSGEGAANRDGAGALRTWWGSVTAALGLNSTAEGEAVSAAPAGEGGGSAAEGSTERTAAPPVLDITAKQEPATPSAVSAFANEVAVKPVSAVTADTSVVAGARYLLPS